MRKILLATTALVGVAISGAAHAAESPIAVNVGGYVDFRAAQFQESNKTIAADFGAPVQTRNSDFETTFQINIEATGKANNGVEYGAKVGLWNSTDDVNAASAATGDSLNEHDAYVWLSGNFGKVVFGDTTGATTDMMVFAPTVGEGQIDGNFDHFTASLFSPDPTYLSDDENSTKINYYTPKVGSANHKVQLGVSYTPNYGEKGEVTSLIDALGPVYRDLVGGAVQYTGKLGPVATAVSGTINTASVNGNPLAAGVRYRDFTTYGIGAQAAYAGFTVGGSYVDAGRAYTTAAQTKAQEVWTAGVKYEAGKVAVAANYLDGKGYANGFNVINAANTNSYGDNYVRGTQEVGLGATYTWFPGLTTAADAVFFQQKIQNNAFDHNEGSVLMLSQKMAF